jgi:hypothetical protein
MGYAAFKKMNGCPGGAAGCCCARALRRGVWRRVELWVCPWWWG